MAIIRVGSLHDEVAMSARPKTPLVLSATEREQLIALAKRRKTAQALALRARIVLACAEGLDCWRRFKIEPPCRLNFEPGLMANL